MLETIAKTYTGLGEYTDAERLLRSALEPRAARASRQTDRAAGTLALSGMRCRTRKVGRSGEAPREELAILRQRHGRESAEAAAALNDLAQDARQQERLPRGREARRRGPANPRRYLPARTAARPPTASDALRLTPTRKTGSATLEECSRQVAIRRSLHDDGPESRGALNDVAVSQTQLGDYDAAEKTFGEAMSIHKRALGEDHPEYASGLENIGNIWYRKGEYARTAQQLEKVLAIRRSALGDDAEPVGRTMANLGAVTSIMGDAAAAEPLYREAEEKLSRFLGPDNPDVAQVLKSQGRNLHRLGKLDEAERALRRALKIELAAFPAGSTPVARTRLFLGLFLTDRKGYPEADEMLRLADEAYRKNEGVANAATQDTIRARVDLYRNWGKPEKARELEASLEPAKTP